MGNQEDVLLGSQGKKYLIITSKVAHQKLLQGCASSRGLGMPRMKVAGCGLRSAKERSQGKDERSKLFPKVHLWRKKCFLWMSLLSGVIRRAWGEGRLRGQRGGREMEQGAGGGAGMRVGSMWAAPRWLSWEQLSSHGNSLGPRLAVVGSLQRALWLLEIVLSEVNGSEAELVLKAAPFCACIFPSFL